MEGFKLTHEGLNTPDEKERRREHHFKAVVQSHLLETFRDALEDADFHKDQIERAAVALGELPEDEARSALALPLEIRDKLFARYKKEGVSAEEMVRNLSAKNRKYGFSLGYHLSNKLVPKITKKDGSIEWDIRGSELDDRDNMKMSYYSEDYVNRYKKNAGRYLYIIRAELGEKTPHKRDLKNRWGRAPFLSIIDEYDLEKIEDEIDGEMKKEDAAATSQQRPTS